MMKKSDNGVSTHLVRTIKVLQYRDGNFEEKYDDVVEEDFLTIEINGSILGTIACLPYQLEYLAFGFLLSEGFISKRSDVVSWHLEEKIFKATLNDRPVVKGDKPTFLSGCGKGITFKDPFFYDEANNSKINS